VALKILLVDDHKMVLKAVRTMLEGYRDWEVCGEALDGREAVDKAIKLHPDLIVMDFAMPRMNGLNAAREISALTPDVPIILNTLYSYAPLNVEAERCGIWATVEKTQLGSLPLAIDKVLNMQAKSHADTLPGDTSNFGVELNLKH
jgi:DNA-binding NarL/FixJ family response regulator